MRVYFMIALMAVSLAAVGCSSPRPTTMATPNFPSMSVDPAGNSHMFTASARAGDVLHEMLLLRMGPGGGILTTSFVDMHDFERTSAFGRVASQQIGSRLGQCGFRVIEARLASTLSMAPRAGEFMLTRETGQLLADTHEASAVLVGSYSDEGGDIFVSTRVVRLSDNVIMAAYEYYLPRDMEVARLITSSGQGGRASVGDSVWERHNSRTPAFAPCGAKSISTVTIPSSRTAMPSSKAITSTPGQESAKSLSAKGATPAVPRYVDPKAEVTAPVRTKIPSAPAAKTTARAPDPVGKDSPAPPSVPGGV